MSLIEYETIYDHAAAVVKSEYGTTPEVTRILEDFRSRALSEERDPLVNRSLMIEPMHDAQVLEVPYETIEKVASQLQRLNILHIWVRVTCPSDEDSYEVVETNSPRIFKDAIGSPCPHCGQLHEDIDWEHIETFYAFHYDKTPDNFRYSTYFRKPQPLPSESSVRQPLLSRIQEWFRGGPLSRFFRLRAPSPAETVIVALETNAPNTRVPSQKETLTTLWLRGTLLVCVGLTVSYFVSLWSNTWAIIVGAAFLLSFTFLAWVTWKAIWAAASLERRVLGFGYLLAFLLLTGATGLGVEGKISNQSTPEPTEHSIKEIQDSEQGNSVLWTLSGEFGKTDHHLIWAGVITFLGTSLIVFGLNWNRVNQR